MQKKTTIKIFDDCRIIIETAFEENDGYSLVI